jgi:hypothetical protein
VTVRPGELVRVTFRSRPFVAKGSSAASDEQSPERVTVAQRQGKLDERGSDKPQADARD